jgi:hypothetical protein
VTVYRIVNKLLIIPNGLKTEFWIYPIKKSLNRAIRKTAYLRNVRMNKKS